MRISDWSSDVCSSDLWWEKSRAALSRIGNLTVLDIGSATVAALGAIANRTMRLQGMVQDGQFELYGEGTSLAIESSVRMAPAGRAHCRDGGGIRCRGDRRRRGRADVQIGSASCRERVCQYV